MKRTEKRPAFALHAVLFLACGCGARSELFASSNSADTPAADGGGCSPGSCAGCCSTSGQCLAGTAPSACGSGGHACAMCSAGTCSAGACRHDTVVLFGVASAGGVYLNTTWTFDGTNWTQVSASNPTPVRGSNMVATLGNEVVNFGGIDVNAKRLGETLADTWAFDGTNWTQVPVMTRPPPRAYAVMATLGNEIVLFGGWSPGGYLGEAVELGDTWTFDGTSWHQVLVSIAPPGRSGAVMATLGNEVVLFGGHAQGMDLGDTWTFDGTSWTEVTGSNAPPARQSGGMATLGDEIVLFGGGNPEGSLDDDTWVFKGTSWTQVSVSKPPPARFSAAMAMLGDEVVLFGGGSYGPNLNDTWVFKGTSWTQVSVSKSPPPSGGAMAALP